MAKKDVLEIRVTFREDQEDLYNYIRQHNSSAGFLKDLAYREMLRDENYIKSPLDNNSNNNHVTLDDIQRLISSYIPQQPMMNMQPYYIPQQPIMNVDPNLVYQTMMNNNQQYVQPPITSGPSQENNTENNEKNIPKRKEPKKKTPGIDFSIDDINVLNKLIDKTQ